MPTRGEWPLNPSPRPTACAAFLMRLDIWLGRSPYTLSESSAPFRIRLSAAMVGTETNATAPPPSGSVFERLMSRRPLPSGTVSMSLQVRTAASETLSIASRMSLISAMSRFPLLSAVSGLSSPPPRPDRRLRAVSWMTPSTSAVSPSACF